MARQQITLPSRETACLRAARNVIPNPDRERGVAWVISEQPQKNRKTAHGEVSGLQNYP